MLTSFSSLLPCRDKAASAAAGGSPKGGNKVDRSQSLKDQKAVRLTIYGEEGSELLSSTTVSRCPINTLLHKINLKLAALSVLMLLDPSLTCSGRTWTKTFYPPCRTIIYSKPKHPPSLFIWPSAARLFAVFTCCKAAPSKDDV